MTKAEKRLYIREVAKDMWSAIDCTGRPVYYIKDAVTLADEIESFERKQDEEDDKMRYCFGIGIKEESQTSEKDCVCRQWDCSSCLVKKQCEDMRKFCFGVSLENDKRKRNCSACSVVSQCQEKRCEK